MLAFLTGTSSELLNRQFRLTGIVLRCLTREKGQKYLTETWDRGLAYKLKWLNHAIVLDKEEPIE